MKCKLYILLLSVILLSGGAAFAQNPFVPSNRVFNTREFKQAVELYNSEKFAEAFQQFEILAKRGHKTAKLYIAFMYHDGTGVQQDYAKAFELFTSLESSNIIQVRYMLGKYYENGYCTEKNLKKALSYYFRAARRGNSSEAMLSLGAIYFNGIDGKKDFGKARYWYKLAARGGNARAMFNIGFLYEKGLDVEQSYKEAFSWYKKAAQYDEPKSLLKLGRLLESGNVLDEKPASYYYALAAEAGSRDGLFCLAQIFRYGRGEKKNSSFALEIFEAASGFGDERAMVAAAEMFEAGEGVEQDSSKALKYYKMGVNSGYEVAEYILGKRYLEGDKVKLNKGLGMDLMKKAAARKYQPAIDYLEEIEGHND